MQDMGECYHAGYWHGTNLTTAGKCGCKNRRRNTGGGRRGPRVAISGYKCMDI
jgi:hypothetical protein